MDGPDDICAPAALRTTAHCFGESVIEGDRLAAAAVARVTGRPVATGTVLMPDEILLDRLRAAFRGEAMRPACAGCEWPISVRAPLRKAIRACRGTSAGFRPHDAFGATGRGCGAWWPTDGPPWMTFIPGR